MTTLPSPVAANWIENIQPILMSNAWFASLAPKHQAMLLEAGRRMPLYDGQYFASQEKTLRHRSVGFAVVLEGMIKVSSTSPDGREAILSFLHPGQWFGELSLFDGMSRENDFVSVGSSEILVIEIEAMQQILKDAEMACQIARLLASRIRMLVALAEGFTLCASLARTARRLVMLAYDDEREEGGKHRECLDVSQDALASMLGMTRQSVASQLKLLAECGAIEQAYGRVKIISMAALKAESIQ